MEARGPNRPHSSADTISEPTAAGARRIFMRFVLVAVGVNLLIGASVVVYHVYDSLRDTRDRLEVIGDMCVDTVRRMRHASDAPDADVLRTAARLLDVPMALVARDGTLRAATDNAIAAALPRVYPEGKQRGVRVQIDEALGELSGAWVLQRFTPRHDLLLVVRRLPEEEGLAIYMTIAAGITGLAIALSFLVMLAAANWMLRRPLSRLVSQLTGALARDVQRRREAEKRAVAARREAEKHLAFMNSLIDASEAVGIVGVDEEGGIQIFNWGASRILGYEAEDVVGKMNLEQLRERPSGEDADPGSPLIHAGEGEEFWARRDGKQVLLDVNTGVIHDAEGDDRGKLVTFIDVTERRKLQAELQLNELQLIQSAKLATLGEMATGIAHELNQPLNNIGLLSSRVRRRLGLQPLDDEERSFYQDKLDKIESQVERAGRIIDHLRTFGRPTETQLSSVEIRRPVEGVMVFLREQLVRHGIEVAIDLPDDLPRVHADEARLEQVLMNLIVNARDALDSVDDDGQRRIRIGARQCSMPGGEPGVGLEVSDNGPGIPADVLDRIFEPFFSTKEVGKGTGLGLSISYGLVRGFGGMLEVESGEGSGTTFTIRLRQAGQEGST